MNRLLTSCVLAAVLALAAGCGDSGTTDAPNTSPSAADRPAGPLTDVLTDAQIGQLERSIADQLNLGSSPDGAPSDAAIQRVRDSCEALDGSVPMLAASKASCGPGLELVTATVAFGTACVAGGDRCAAALDELSDVVPAFTKATLKMHKAVGEAVSDPQCRDQLGGTEAQVRAVRELPSAAKAAAKSADGDPAEFAAALGKLVKVLEAGAGTTDPVAYMDATRKACGLPNATPVAGPASPA